jgi:uncharacterized repeat protein (TIGR02543 family)
MKQYYKAPIAALAAALLTALAALALSGCDNPSGAPTEPETWTVAFNAQGGTSAPGPQTVAKGARADKPPDPAFGGRALIGWYTEADALNPWNFNDPVTGDLTLYAKWTLTVVEAGSWELSFNSRGGPAVEAQIVANGETAAMPTAPVRSNYDFRGWHKEAACENLWDFDTDIVTAHTILYARWTPTVITFTVQFDPRGGAPVPPDQTVEQGGKPTQPVVAKPGFLPAGWAPDPEDGPAWDFALDTVEEDLTLYARWTAVSEDQAVVSFNTGEGGPVLPSQAVDKGGKPTRPVPDPQKPGFDFDGWFKDQLGQTPWDFDTDTVEADTVIYAKWTALYTVTFDSRGGNDVEGAVVRAGSKAQKPADPTRGADRFEGWHSSVTDTPWNFDSVLTGSITLYARWTALYTVTFDSKGGDLVPKVEGLLEGATITEPTAPARDKNTFAGWHSDSAYANPWDFANDTVSGNITLYAKWTAKVQFNAAGGSNAPADQTVTSGLPMSAPSTVPGRVGWSFAGWHKELAGTNRWDFALDTVTGDMTLYAKWEIIPATGINNVPADGLINEALDLGDATVTPPNASVKDIVWTVKSAGTTGVDPATVDGPFTPTAAGTLVLTATVPKGGEGGEDYAENFDIKITTIREVADILNAPTDGFAGLDVDMGGATALPANATNKTIVWTVKTPGAGVASISGSVFKPTAVGTLVLTATIVNGSEDEAGNLSNYTKDFTIAVHSPESKPGNVGLGEDTTIKLYAGTNLTPLPTDSVVTVARDSTYYVRIPTAYTNIVWRLNGTISTVTGNRLYLDTGKVGTVKLTVEAVTNGVVDTGTYVFKIE